MVTNPGAEYHRERAAYHEGQAQDYRRKGQDLEAFENEARARSQWGNYAESLRRGLPNPGAAWHKARAKYWDELENKPGTDASLVDRWRTREEEQLASEFESTKLGIPNPLVNLDPLTIEAKSIWQEDRKAGHSRGEDYWAGYAAGSFLHDKNPLAQVSELALEAKKRYLADVQAGHTRGIDYWSGFAASSYLRSNPRPSKKILISEIRRYARIAGLPLVRNSVLDVLSQAELEKIHHELWEKSVNSYGI